MGSSARVVIVGSGIVGSSVAYHLAMAGWKDVIVLDKGRAVHNDGSTSHAPGGVVALSHNKLLTQMGAYGSALFGRLPEYSTERRNYHQVGLLELAMSERRFLDLKRLHGEGKSYGVESHLLSPGEAAARHPYVDTDQTEGALFVPSGALVASVSVNGALQTEATRIGGVRFMGGVTVTDLETVNGSVTAVLTSDPDLTRIECDHVVLCTNLWGPVLGDRLGVPIPLRAFQHQFVITAPLPSLAGFDQNRADQEVTVPTVRELDGSMYYRQYWDSFGIGSYWHTPRPVDPYQVGKSAEWEFTPADFLGPPWERARRLMPMLAEADPSQFTHRYNGLFAFTVDGLPVIGETDTRGLWVGIGAWLTHAPGVGKSLAEWMTTGETEWDMRLVNVHRFAGFQTTPKYVQRACDLNYAEVYEIVHPRRPIAEPRNVRLSAFHERHRELGAEFTVFAGLELPNWYRSNQLLAESFSQEIPSRSGWEAMNWSPIQGAEHLETRRNVALFDLTGLSIIEVTGPEALAFVDYLCSSGMDKPVGQVVYTTWLTERGGVRRDLAVARLATDRFWLFVGEGSRPQDLVWVRRAAARFTEVSVVDMSDSYSALGLWGPNARRVLAKVTSVDLSNEAFPYFSCAWIDIGFSKVLAVRISYAGELGWELHIPTETSLPVWDFVWEAGREFGLIAAGMGAFDSLRLEKGYRLWGGDVHTEYDPYEAGLGWVVKLSKGRFVGKGASEANKARPLKKTLCCLTSDHPGAMALGNEPIMNGSSCVGYVTSANYGYNVGRFIVYGYLPADLAPEGTRLDVEYFGQRFPFVVSADPQWDPRMERLKS